MWCGTVGWEKEGGFILLTGRQALKYVDSWSVRHWYSIRKMRAEVSLVTKLGYGGIADVVWGQNRLKTKVVLYLSACRVNTLMHELARQPLTSSRL